MGKGGAACFSTQLKLSAIEVFLPWLGSALDGYMTLSKSFWLLRSFPLDFICLLYANGFSIFLY